MPLVPRLSEEHRFQNISCKTMEKYFSVFSSTGISSGGNYIWKNLGEWWHVDVGEDEEVGSIRGSLE